MMDMADTGSFVLGTVTDSGSRITGGGSGYAALLAHAGGVLYGMELGSVTLKRIGFFCFPIKHSTHTVGTLKECCKGLGSVSLKNKQPTHTAVITF